MSNLNYLFILIVLVHKVYNFFVY